MDVWAEQSIHVHSTHLEAVMDFQEVSLGGKRLKSCTKQLHHRLRVLPPDLGFSPQEREFSLCILLIRSYYLPIKQF